MHVGLTLSYSSMVIDHLLSQYGELRVAYVYCDYRDQTNQSLANILSSILGQLLTATTNIPEAVVGILEALQKDGKRLELSDVSRMLKLTIPQVATDPVGLFLCIDALDELEPRVRLGLLEALQSEFGGTRIFLRPTSYRIGC